MRKNILIFGHSYATQFIDISNQYTQLFCKEKFAVTVVYLVGEYNQPVRDKHLAENVIFLNTVKSSARGLKLAAIKKMLALCHQQQFEIVICHRYKPTFVMLWVNLFCRIPVIFSVMHELGTLALLTRKITIAALAKKNIIFAGVSDAVRDNIRQAIWRIAKERVITLHNMIDVEFTESHLLDRTDARNAFNLPPDIFIFGNIGRLAINKDQHSLIQAFALLKPHCPHAKLVIIGDGQLETELKNHAQKLQVSDDIIFTGFVPDAFRFLKAFDVFISTSIQEAFGRVLLEAMIAQIPIIATAVNGVPEVIGDKGKLIPARHVGELTQEMTALYHASSHLRQTLGAAGYHRAIQHFSLQRFKEIFWQIPLIQARNLV